MRKIEVTIKGISPLLMHRFDDSMPKHNKNTTDEELAEASAYINNKGELYQPADHILGSLVKAGTNFIVGGKGKKTFKEFIKGGVIITPDAIPHIIPKYEIDKRRAVIQRAAIMRVRPRLDEWELSFQIQIINENITSAELNKILTYAGESIGIGDFRPRFGRFIVAKYKEI